MIASLNGVVAQRGLNDAVIDVQGVGYRVAFSLLALTRLPEEGQKAKVRIRTVVREDAFELYGFLSAEEEEMFLLLTSVSGVGPKLAISVLSGLEVEALAEALSQKDVARLTRIRGVGKKTAERLALELQEKAKMLLGPAQAATSGKAAKTKILLRSDLVSALGNLGYRQTEAEQASDAVLEELGEGASFEAAFRQALASLRKL